MYEDIEHTWITTLGGASMSFLPSHLHVFRPEVVDSVSHRRRAKSSTRRTSLRSVNVKVR